ncbi:GDSL-type esterase/lipase family protein [Mesorhizobium sp.]|uniref:SGNH/GDSL hydrolase family protein n=2 Tax=Mesorhizobium sp. TaxID=1871066 RepID=UPI00257B64FF|nr:GDSL-type esterase/lipase family protein [Mesorhizobium sp.]
MGLIKFRGILSVWKGRVIPRNAVPWSDHWTVRTAAIAAHLRWIGPDSLMLVGDSLFELVPPHPLEGLKVVNAGFGGATAANVYASIASSVVMSALKANPPAKAVIQAGTNDSKTGADPVAVAEKTMAICSLFRSIGAEPIVFAIPPIEEKKTAFRSASVASAINDATRQACVRSGVPFIDPYVAIRGSNDVTEDGIHLARGAVVALVDAIRAA